MEVPQNEQELYNPEGGRGIPYVQVPGEAAHDSDLMSPTIPK
jgi:hypothetical protein